MMLKLTSEWTELLPAAVSHSSNMMYVNIAEYFKV